MKFEKLEDIITIAKGKKPILTDEPNSNSIRFLQIDDLRNDNNIKYTNEKNGVIATKDDILLAWDGANAGTVGYGKDGYIGSTIAVLRKKDPKKYSTVFIGKFLQSQFEYLRSNATGATIPHIDRRSLENLKIPVLEIEDQIHIANILSKAEALISQRKESLRLLDELLKSTFLEMFGDPVRNEKGWEKIELSKLFEVRGRVGWKGYKKTDLRNSGPYVLGATHLSSDGYLDLSKPVYISREKFVESPEIVVERNDMLIVQRGNTIGKVSIVNRDIGEATINPCILIVRPINGNSHFLKQYLMDQKVMQQLWSMNTSSAQPMLTQKDLRAFNIYNPPLKLQTQFAHIVEKTEALKAHYQTSLQELENLYGSLSQRAFKGELVPLRKGEGELSLAAESRVKYGKKQP